MKYGYKSRNLTVSGPIKEPTNRNFNTVLENQEQTLKFCQRRPSYRMVGCGFLPPSNPVVCSFEAICYFDLTFLALLFTKLPKLGYISKEIIVLIFLLII